MRNELLENWLEYSKSQKNIEKKLETLLKRGSQVSLSEYYALYELNKHGNKMKISELANYLCLSTSAFSRVIKRLEEKEVQFVTKTVCLEDKRSIYVKLTGAGEVELAKAQHLIDEGLNKYYHIEK